ncbi:MAG: type II toxin-antitoxin system VapC family toxin [Candidatus Woesearchaeota archaeon]|nr:type II toxin-antitoxin system VapC family toxin [Candidatus Woesearchaeota archaeon]
MAVLDTDFLVGILRKNKDAVKKFEEIGPDEPLRTTVFNIHELIEGVCRSSKPEQNMKQVDELIKDIEILSYLDHYPQTSGKISADLIETGKMIGIIDVFIATITLKNGEALITKNKEHFENIEGLKIILW